MKSGVPEMDQVTVLLSFGGVGGCVDGRSAGDYVQEHFLRVCSEKKRRCNDKRAVEVVPSVHSCNEGRGARKTRDAGRGPSEGRPTSCSDYYGPQRTANQ